VDYPLASQLKNSSFVESAKEQTIKAGQLVSWHLKITPNLLGSIIWVSLKMGYTPKMTI
jgi:hypothetical protein